MFWVLLRFALPFGLFHHDFGSTSELGCCRLFQAVLGLLKCALSFVLLFEVPFDLQVGSRCSRLFKLVFLIVLGCFSIF